MSKALIYTANTTVSAVPVGSSIPVGSIVRRYGNIASTGSSINLTEAGYYDLDLNVDFTSTAGLVTIKLLQDGVPIAGASVTITVVTATNYAVTIPAMIRVFCGNSSKITAVVDAASTATPTFTNVALKVVKV